MVVGSGGGLLFTFAPAGGRVQHKLEPAAHGDLDKIGESRVTPGDRRAIGQSQEGKVNCVQPGFPVRLETPVFFLPPHFLLSSYEAGKRRGIRM